MDEKLLVDEVWIDNETKMEDELLLVSKINLLLKRIKSSRERICVVICLEERNVLKVR